MKHLEVETFNFRKKKGIKNGYDKPFFFTKLELSWLSLRLVHVFYMKIPMVKSYVITYDSWLWYEINGAVNYCYIILSLETKLVLNFKSLFEQFYCSDNTYCN
jgi:hypothetical protein